ncbi:MAG: CHAT domain-containing protein, partial [Planctomycetes bacterium]|nr:CHAT domain-containing protein [Planctomycetota bacterium]
ACETALGEQSRGDELVSLSRAFLYAGTPVVVASLWPVEDEATAALMTAFHQHFQAGMSPAAALTEAQAKIREQSDWAAPYYWAGFIVIGDGGSDVVKSPPTPTPLPPTVTPTTETLPITAIPEVVAREVTPASVETTALPIEAEFSAEAAPATNWAVPITVSVGLLVIVVGVVAWWRRTKS